MKRTNKCNAGFTLLEMLVSLAIFMTVGGVALSVVSKSLPLYNRQQGTTSLNLGLRSAVSQIEQDVVNAGTGYYVGVNFPDWPIGVTIINTPGGSCYNSTTHAYGANCFDTLNVLTTDLTTPPVNLNAATNSNTNTTLDVKLPTSNNPATSAPWTAAAFAAKFVSGDQILLLNSGGSQLTTFKLSANGAVNGAVVRLTHSSPNNITNANGTNGSNAGASGVACTQTTPPANDPLGISMCWNSKLGPSFVANNDWVLKLSSVTYRVDATNTANPKLVRRVGAGTEEVLVDQIIGFKVGASLWNNYNGTDDYRFSAAKYPDISDQTGDENPTNKDPFNFSRVRSVRVSLIGRTTPITDPTNKFRNTFDNGAYQIQAVSVTVNPRNLSMKDN